ncbi:armadillo-type protein [Halteromyces radiatus]|uniref:armadillo-type protein n=1 Tax=Halteromyces radiatus TaxID=101107 RepID=UPI002220C3C3|nr:armadillo-type protein [Halteromyces radiatus]KAI8098666.1 armadillo-type protein [Halteromyces radiatus]
MTIDEFDPDDLLVEINRKLANVSIQSANLTDTVHKNALSSLRYYLHSDNIETCFVGAHNLRKYLTQATEPGHVDDLLELDILPRIKQLLSYHEHSELQFECAWIVTNIAAGTSEHTNALVEADFIGALLEILYSKISTTTSKAQAAWALSNFAGESPALRELLLTNSAIGAVANVLDSVCDEIMDDAIERSYSSGRVTIRDHDLCIDVKALTWSLSNMCRGGFRTADYWDMYLPAFYSLSQCAIFDHKDIWIDSCWGLSRILYNMHEVTSFYDAVPISPQLCSRLAQLLTERTISIIVPVLRCIINITSGPNEYSALLLDTPLLTNLGTLTPTSIPIPIRRDSFLVVSNLAASNETLVNQVIQSHEIMESVVAHVHVPGHTYHEDTIQWFPTVSNAYYNLADEWKITTEALWALSNLTNLASDDSICTMLASHPQIPKSLSALLNYMNMPLSTCIKGLDVIITIIGRTNKIAYTRLPSSARLTDQENKDSPSIPSSSNPYIEQFINQGLPTLLPCLRKVHQKSMELQKRCVILASLLETAVSSDQSSTSGDKSTITTTTTTTTTATTTTSSSSSGSTPSSSTSSNLAAMFGLSLPPSFITTGANKRRVLRGHEDGDIRLIENAVGNLSITEGVQ